jgi:hypothetical protein
VPSGSGSAVIGHQLRGSRKRECAAKLAVAVHGFGRNEMYGNTGGAYMHIHIQTNAHQTSCARAPSSRHGARGAMASIYIWYVVFSDHHSPPGYWGELLGPAIVRLLAGGWRLGVSVRASCPKIRISNGFLCPRFFNLHHFLYGTPSSWGHGGYSKKVMVRFPPKLLYLYVEYQKKRQSRRKNPTQRLTRTNRLGGWICM